VYCFKSSAGKLWGWCVSVEVTKLEQGLGSGIQRPDTGFWSLKLESTLCSRPASTKALLCGLKQITSHLWALVSISAKWELKSQPRPGN
jgi:hypothetical protein